MNLSRFYLYAFSVILMCTLVIGINQGIFHIRSADLSFGTISLGVNLITLIVLVFYGPGTPEPEKPYMMQDEELETVSGLLICKRFIEDPPAGSSFF